MVCFVFHHTLNKRNLYVYEDNNEDSKSRFIASVCVLTILKV